MDRLTDRLYRRWLAQNGAVEPSRHRTGGMGGVPPMQARTNPSKPSSRVQPPAPAPVVAARPIKPLPYASK